MLTCPRKLTHGNPHITLQTDASSIGWGGTLVNSKSTGGRWLSCEKSQHINALELRAVLYSLQALIHDMNDVHILLQIDNTTAVTYLREMGGSHSQDCNQLAHDIWEWCIDRRIWLSVTHIPGPDKLKANSLSRQFDDKTEWKLSQQAFHYCIEL